MTVVPAHKRRRLTPSRSSDEDSSPSTLVSQAEEPTSNDFFTNVARWDLEQAYEQRPRRKSAKQNESTRLPIKTAEGRVEQLQVPGIHVDDRSSWQGSDDQETKKSPEVEEKAPAIPIGQQIVEAQEELARVAGLISEDPEEHVGGFRTLAHIAASSNLTIRKLALVTQLAVYKDVIPGYRIRPIAESDMAEKLSKEVRRLRAYEQALVSSYQMYLKELAKYAKRINQEKSEASTSLADVAISCACTLLLAVPHFNFRGEILQILVTHLSSKKIDKSFLKCRETIETLFRDDEDGNASLEAVTMLTRMTKARDYQIDESVLNTFLHLRLLSEFSSKGSQNQIDRVPTAPTIKGKKLKAKREFRTKKQRKILKERKGIEKEFKEADAIVSREERDKMQAETLKLVFVLYFRILKARSPKLMGAVLEGLAKYAHLINQDFFGDLLEALKDLIIHADTLLLPNDPEESDSDPAIAQLFSNPSSANRTRSSLLCIITAFALLSGQDVSRSASALKLDLTFFTTHLYRSLHALALSPTLELGAKSLPQLPSPEDLLLPTPTPIKKVNYATTAVLLLRALSAILTPRTTPPLRLAAFTKQLFTCTLHLPEKSATAVLALLHSVVKMQGRKVRALWNTEETKGDGIFDPKRADIEGSNPFATTVWEGELLRLHFCPAVREAVKGVEKVVEEV